MSSSTKRRFKFATLPASIQLSPSLMIAPRDCSSRARDSIWPRLQPVSEIAFVSESPSAVRRAIRASRTAAGFPSASTERNERTAGALAFNGALSSTTPPPMVTTGENCRRINRSAGSSNMGCAVRSCAIAVSPGRISFVPCNTTSATASSVKACRCTRARSRKGRALLSTVNETSARDVGSNTPAAARVMPRAKACVETSVPAKFSAVRCPAVAVSADRPCTSMPRTRARWRCGKISISDSLLTAPATSVPVTTVPKPFMVNTRSMGSRKYAEESFAGTSLATRASSRLSSSTPAPAFELTAITGASARNEPRKKSATSKRATAKVSSSTRSALVSTVMPRRTANSRQISKCSRVRGLIDSSAAITNSTTSMPPTPASMLRTKRSCPGTSTNPRRSFSPPRPENSRWANPRSMVMPRRFSSCNRSASIPVSALTSAVLP